MNGKEKIEIILNELGIKAPTFCNTIGIPYQRIFDIQRGKTKKISGDIASAISHAYPQYQINWLLTDDEQSAANLSKNKGNINYVVGNRNKVKAESPANAKNEMSRLLSIIEKQSSQLDVSQEQINKLLVLLEKK